MYKLTKYTFFTHIFVRLRIICVETFLKRSGLQMFSSLSVEKFQILRKTLNDFRSMKRKQLLYSYWNRNILHFSTCRSILYQIPVAEKIYIKTRICIVCSIAFVHCTKLRFMLFQLPLKGLTFSLIPDLWCSYVQIIECFVLFYELLFLSLWTYVLWYILSHWPFSIHITCRVVFLALIYVNISTGLFMITEDYILKFLIWISQLIPVLPNFSNLSELASRFWKLLRLSVGRNICQTCWRTAILSHKSFLFAQVLRVIYLFQLLSLNYV